MKLSLISLFLQSFISSCHNAQGRHQKIETYSERPWVNWDLLETNASLDTNARFETKTEMRIESSRDLYNRVVDDMAGAVQEFDRGDAWGKDVATKKVNQMKFKIKMIKENLERDTKTLMAQKGIPKATDISMRQVDDVNEVIENGKALLGQINDFEHKIGSLQGNDMDPSLQKDIQKFQQFSQQTENWQNQEKDAEQMVQKQEQNEKMRKELQTKILAQKVIHKKLLENAKKNKETSLLAAQTLKENKAIDLKYKIIQQAKIDEQQQTQVKQQKKIVAENWNYSANDQDISNAEFKMWSSLAAGNTDMTSTPTITTETMDMNGNTKTEKTTSEDKSDANEKSNTSAEVDVGQKIAERLFDSKPDEEKKAIENHLVIQERQQEEELKFERSLALKKAQLVELALQQRQREWGTTTTKHQNYALFQKENKQKSAGASKKTTQKEEQKNLMKDIKRISKQFSPQALSGEEPNMKQEKKKEHEVGKGGAIERAQAAISNVAQIRKSQTKSLSSRSAHGKKSKGRQGRQKRSHALSQSSNVEADIQDALSAIDNANQSAVNALHWK